MPANVTIDFEKARFKYSQANSPQAKLEALFEMQRFAPAHKGAENLRADISKKIAATKREIEKQKIQEKKRGGKTGLSVKKEGIGQIVIIGFPNSGKSTLLNALTGIGAEVAPYPFTTKKPQFGMMDFKGAKVQIVELPAIVEGSSKGHAQGTQILSVIRTADGVVLLAGNSSEEEAVKKELADAKIVLNQTRPLIEIRHSKFRGITVSGKKFLKCRESELVALLKSLGMHNSEVVLGEPTTIQKVLQAMDEAIVYKKALVINPFEEKNIEELKPKIFALLGKILVYTKKPGREPDLKDPLAMKKGATVGDVARHLHKDFARSLKYAKVWGSTKFPGQRVQKEFELKDGDVIEIYS
ncbi:MAG: 50S ribosome-binding GTPase [Candidatus ainarchaeum sp.]|nr:50S ribosome-binding GTPase [Candidatus ainarchaeum sp.]